MAAETQTQTDGTEASCYARRSNAPSSNHQSDAAESDGAAM